MLSLESVTDPDAVRRFGARVRDGAHAASRGYVLEPKFDGLSLEIVYRNGVLARASTRGDGERGGRVTEHVRRRCGQCRSGSWTASNARHDCPPFGARRSCASPISAR